MTLSIILIFISGVSFVIYGISTFLSKKMLLEYKRWGYSEHRLMIGFLQLSGGIGLLLGLLFETLIPLCSSSLLLLMLAAIGVRIKIKDQPLSILPALSYAIINFLILVNNIF